MKIEKIKISYSTTIPIMSYGVNDKIGVEMELSPESGQLDLEQIISEHKANVDAIVRKLYPNIWQKETKPLTEYEALVLQEESQYKIHGISEEVIRSCNDLKVLSMYEKIIDREKDEEKKRELWLTYDEVYAKLSNQNTTTK